MARRDPPTPPCAHQHARGTLPVHPIPVDSASDAPRRLEHLAPEARRTLLARVLGPRAVRG